MLLLAAGLAGFAVLTLEVLGVHHLAPWFGASAPVWTNQIGVILLALALGGWLGGWRSRSCRRPVRLAGWLLAAAGVLVAVSLVALPPLAEWLLPDQLRLEEAAGIFLAGSLAASLLLFVPPVLLLGMVAPLLVQSRSAARGAGRAAGEITAAGTLGSLAGVFGTTWVAIPVLGTRLTLLASAAALLLAGLLLIRRPAPAALAVLLLVPVLLPDPAATANLPAGARVLAESQTPYQRLRVIEFTRPGYAERWLQMNEGLDSFQSRWRSDGGWPGGYYDLFALGPVYARAGEEPRSAFRFWSLGHAAGTAVRAVAAALEDADWSAVGVEIDPGAARLGREWLPLPPGLDARVQVAAGLDGRTVLRSAPAGLDLVLVDAYSRQFEIPLHLATVEFFREVRGRLRDGGVVVLNVGSSELRNDPLGFVDSLRAGLAEVFGGRVRGHRVPYSRNVLLFARKNRPLPALEDLADLLPPGLPREIGAACLPSQVLEGVPSGPAARLTDDRNPLYYQQARLWLAGAAQR